MKSKRDPRIDAYIKTAPDFARPILKLLRKLIHESCPKAEEEIKWGKPWYLYNDKVLCGTVTFKAHMAFLFNKSSSMVNEQGQPAKLDLKPLRHITSADDLPSSRILKFYIKQAMKLNEPGAKLVKKEIKRKPPVKTPTDLLVALKANRKALAMYESFSESNKRHYVDWIADAKTEETHEKRLEKSVECIAAGKLRHWK